MQTRLLPFLLLAPAAALAADAPLSFNRDIRPILSENCFYCHGQDPNHRKGDLRLDVREATLSAADSGEIAIVPGKPDESALIQRVFSSDRDEQMPPAKSNRVLTAAQKEMLKRWIAEGAKYETHWAFITPQRPALPAVQRADWPKNAIDRFVLARLEREKLAPSPEADRATLIRRVSLDLIGLPPTPEEVDAFIADAAPDAYERVVDRLLASPHYGERMALPWLDAARYADSNGFQQDGDTFQWLWRDWLVRALNADMPFDQFSTEQLAGDLLPKPTQDQLIATAFNRNHLLNGEGGAIPEEQRFNILFDRVDTTATTWLGLTMACAQCHDHKYDPITARDYYGLLDAFNQVSETGLAGTGPGRFRVAGPAAEIFTDATRARLAELEKAHQDADTAAQSKTKSDLAYSAWRAAVVAETPGIPNNLTPLLRIAADKRTDEEKEKIESGLLAYFEPKVWPKIAEKDAALKKALQAKRELDKFRSAEIPRVMVMRDDKRRDSHVLDRGEYLKPTDKVGFATPAFLPALAADAPRNRLGLAQWLFQPENPLTARVQVNRMWQLFFGAGLVRTSENLGVQSEMPVHGELLDWLAVEFRESGWRMKALRRLIVTSATYRQSSKVSPELLLRDSENRLLARGARFRAPSFILRDVALAASGLLDSRVGGPPVFPYQPDGIWETLRITYPTSKGDDLYRRSLYTFWRRTASPADMFDVSQRQTCKVREAITCTPLHALTTLNDPTWVEAARALAERSFEAAPETSERLTYAFRRVLGRAPAGRDLELLQRAYEKQLAIYTADPGAAEQFRKVGVAPASDDIPPPQHAALAAVCLALFNLDEALTRE